MKLVLDEAVVLKFQSVCLLLCDCPKNIVITSKNLYHARYVFLGKNIHGGETKKPREIPEEFSTSTKKESTRLVARNFLTRILLMCLCLKLCSAHAIQLGYVAVHLGQQEEEAGY